MVNYVVFICEVDCDFLFSFLISRFFLYVNLKVWVLLLFFCFSFCFFHPNVVSIPIVWPVLRLISSLYTDWVHISLAFTFLINVLACQGLALNRSSPILERGTHLMDRTARHGFTETWSIKSRTNKEGAYKQQRYPHD